MPVRRGARRLLLTGLWVLPLLALLGGCASHQTVQAINPLSGTRSVALLEVREPRQHTLYNYGSPVSALGIVGQIAQEMDFDGQTERFNQMLAKQRLQLGRALDDRLAKYLESMGYAVIRVPDKRGEPISTEWTDGWWTEAWPSLDLAALDVGTDLLVDIRILRSGYISTGGVNAYNPALSIDVRIYSVRERRLLKQGRMAYGTRPFLGETTMVPASQTYSFATTGRLMAQPGIAAEGLTAGSHALAGRIVQEFPWAKGK